MKIKTNRRNFLGTIATALIIAPLAKVISPERKLWKIKYRYAGAFISKELWQHVAVSADKDGEIAGYINGKEITVEQMKEYGLRFGKAAEIK